MRKHFICALVFLIAGLTTTVCLAGSGVEMSIERSFDVKAQPLDTDVSRDGRYIYMLTSDGKILVYTISGKLEGTLDAPPGTTEIIISPKSDLLYLIGEKNKKISAARVDIVREIDTSGAPVKGPVNAPVTIVEFSDFQCPYCARLAPVLDQVLAKYPDKVRLVFKNYPLKSHKFAQEAAEAAQAAGMQGKFWPFYEQLFKNFNALNDQKIQEIAKSVGLDMERFQKDRVSSLAIGQVDQDTIQGNAIGITGVPAIFINGKLLRKKSLEDISAEVDQILSRGK